MKKELYVKKGEIYTYDFGINPGSVQNGVRPALVIQGNEFNKHSPTTIIVPISSILKKTYLPSHIVIGKKYGLKEPSMLLLEQIRTVNQYELDKYIGKIEEEKMFKKIWKAYKKTMGMWNYTKRNNRKKCYNE